MTRLFMILCLLLLFTALGSSASLAQSKLDASILAYDGKDFVRTETTLMNKGQSAVGTKLASDSPAYKALVEKHSYTGPATVLPIDRRPVCRGPEIVVIDSPSGAMSSA